MNALVKERRTPTVGSVDHADVVFVSAPAVFVVQWQCH